MRNQTQFKAPMADLLDLQDELNQHIAQAKALVAYMGADLSQNDGFTVNDAVLDGVLWTVQTLLCKAEETADKINQLSKQGGVQ